ncbi:hypothetical protein NEOLEDRAFT_1184691 [Neolentinus lepideus HHB14362 ss-1]|uniref:Retrovirus-related Pol polyprotein from transposon TNT 1-94-like beta-barrel domain-containing protein n=1 Tax=Neolentinus lepideus HHB14362 ss-1 TaxID=1314782 RepID=A0A165M770_9AGAM|nr:hypothetical protein NEOLEDRAFT_1184691 [Neolentinus lepideus HHB14362 ss-1]
MWLKLKEVHVQQKPGMRFNTYDVLSEASIFHSQHDVLLGLRKLEGESLASLMARADKAMQDICALHPRDFTIDSLDNDLASMALICALPAEYNNFVSSLLLLDSLDLSKLQSAFQNEESQRVAQGVDASPSLAMAASSSSSQGVCCSFCNWEGHTEASCKFKENAAKTQKAKTADRHQERRGGKKKAQNAQEVSEDVEASANIAVYAGKASVALSASDRSSWLSSLAAANWNTNTGATSHMTPHQHWFASYLLHIIPVRLANDTIIYTAGMGSVMFEPVLGGSKAPVVVLHDVLHVPQLGSNLLAIAA